MTRDPSKSPVTVDVRASADQQSLDSTSRSFESVWLVVESQRYGPMQYAAALSRMAALHFAGTELSHMNVVAARHASGADGAFAALDVLLPGENPGSILADEARHWCQVYRELLNRKELALAEVNETVSAASARLGGDHRLDTALIEHRARLQTQVSSYRLRLGYWKPRWSELAREKSRGP